MGVQYRHCHPPHPVACSVNGGGVRGLDCPSPSVYQRTSVSGAWFYKHCILVCLSLKYTGVLLSPPSTAEERPLWKSGCSLWLSEKCQSWRVGGHGCSRYGETHIAWGWKRQSEPCPQIWPVSALCKASSTHGSSG